MPNKPKRHHAPYYLPPVAIAGPPPPAIRSTMAKGYGPEWRQAAKRYLRQNRLCVRCHGKGIVTIAQVVDHTIPHCGDPVLFWDQSNWQPLCKSCHDQKTATEDGGSRHEPPY